MLKKYKKPFVYLEKVMGDVLEELGGRGSNYLASCGGHGGKIQNRGEYTSNIVKT